MSRGNPRRSAPGPDILAQSSGECPGLSATSLPSFLGFEETVGGGVRPLGGPRLGIGRLRLGSGDAWGSVEEPAAYARADGMGRGGGGIMKLGVGAAGASGACCGCPEDRTSGDDVSTFELELGSGRESNRDGIPSSMMTAGALGVACSS